ncbi:MAG: hypothetical protein PWP52_358 [Bacteroidales bacterium]|nr:hypothetical protein [Bacteroidales bacterium]
MSEISLNTEQLRTAAKTFTTKAGEVEEAITSANTSFEPIRGYISKRVSLSVEEWDTLRKKFITTLDELIETANELTKTGDDFDTTDKGGIS